MLGLFIRADGEKQKSSLLSLPFHQLPEHKSSSLTSTFRRQFEEPFDAVGQKPCFGGRLLLLPGKKIGSSEQHLMGGCGAGVGSSWREAACLHHIKGQQLQIQANLTRETLILVAGSCSNQGIDPNTANCSRDRQQVRFCLCCLQALVAGTGWAEWIMINAPSQPSNTLIHKY